MIRLTHDEMRALGREAEGVRLTDDSGFLGQLTVYHNLHCVVRGNFLCQQQQSWT
jgi:hypothetical protein